MERAHGATTLKPMASPRLIIIRFLDFSVKQMVLIHVWRQKNAEFQGKRVYLDKDFSADVLGRRNQVREVITKRAQHQSPSAVPVSDEDFYGH